MSANESTIESVVRRVRQAMPGDTQSGGSPGAPNDVAQAAPGAARAGDPRVARLEQQCTRLANELASVARDADDRAAVQRRALTVAREQIAALEEERDRLLQALRDSNRQLAELSAQLTLGEVRAGFAADFHSSMASFLERHPTAASDARAPGESPQDPGSETIVLSTEGDAQPGSPPPPQPACGSRRAPRIRRFLLPLQPDVDPPFELAGPRCYVGRGGEADVCLSHASISRLHGVLYCIGGATLVEDARSTNGVFVNDERVAQAVLKDGDVVAFGTVAFRFRIAAS